MYQSHFQQKFFWHMQSVKTQISLRSRAVWSVSSLFAMTITVMDLEKSSLSNLKLSCRFYDKMPGNNETMPYKWIGHYCIKSLLLICINLIIELWLGREKSLLLAYSFICLISFLSFNDYRFILITQNMFLLHTYQWYSLWAACFLAIWYRTPYQTDVFLIRITFA